MLPVGVQYIGGVMKSPTKGSSSAVASRFKLDTFIDLHSVVLDGLVAPILIPDRTQLLQRRVRTSKAKEVGVWVCQAKTAGTINICFVFLSLSHNVTIWQLMTYLGG